MTEPDDPDAVRRHDELIEQVRGGDRPDDLIAQHLADWRADVDAEPMPDVPLYAELAARYGTAVPELDAQARAYREMRPQDAVPDEALRTFAERTHVPQHGEDVTAGLRGPEWYERVGWDHARQDPRP